MRETVTEPLITRGRAKQTAGDVHFGFRPIKSKNAVRGARNTLRRDGMLDDRKIRCSRNARGGPRRVVMRRELLRQRRFDRSVAGLKRNDGRPVKHARRDDMLLVNNYVRYVFTVTSRN